MTDQAKVPPADDLSFEQALAQVEMIVERIESGEAGLEDSIKEYEQGAALIQRCKAVLSRAEKRIAELTYRESPQSESDSETLGGDA